VVDAGSDPGLPAWAIFGRPFGAMMRRDRVPGCHRRSRLPRVAALKTCRKSLWL